MPSMFSIYPRIYSGLKYLKDGTADETNGRHLIAPEIVKVLRDLPSPCILDVGAGHGADLVEIERQVGANKPKLFAIEFFQLQSKFCVNAAST